jgi:hypothetical protein
VNCIDLKVRQAVFGRRISQRQKQAIKMVEIFSWNDNDPTDFIKVKVCTEFNL